MSRAEFVLYRLVVEIALVHIPNEQPDRGPRLNTLKDAREYFDLVGLLALRHVPRLARPAALEFVLDIALIEFHTRRATIDNAAERDAVALAKRRNNKILSNTVARHYSKP
jgi:hypothetical protein